MLYRLLFITHYFLLHTSYIFIFLYFYMFLYVYLYIFLQFSYSSLYGLLTANSRLTLQFSLQLTLPYSCLPYGQPDGWLYSSLYVFLYGSLYGYLYTVFSFFSYYPYMLYYSLFILIINLHCILNTIFYYIFTPTPF